MEKSLDKKVALITGAGSGIGKATALLFSKHGARVVVSDISNEKGVEVVKEIKKEVTLGIIDEESKQIGIGITLVTDRDVEVNPPITFSSGNIGGPSAGLMFSLEIYDQLTEGDLTKGYQIAGTGEIDYEGNFPAYFHFLIRNVF